MPVTMAFKCLALIYTMKTGEEVKNHKDRAVIKQQQEAAELLINRKQQNG